MDDTLDLSRVHKKLAEAQFFLGKMEDQERRIIGDREPFDYYLSAFLSAARTVDYRLRHEQATTYPAWRTTWDARLAPEEDSLIKFMIDDRNVEVHESGSSRSVAQEGVEFPTGAHQVDSGVLEIFGPPGMPPAVVYRPTYNFTIDGADHKATQACASYLKLLRKLVSQFEATFHRTARAILAMRRSEPLGRRRSLTTLFGIATFSFRLGEPRYPWFFRPCRGSDARLSRIALAALRPTRPVDRSAAHRTKAERETRIVRLLNRGVSIAEIAGRRTKARPPVYPAETICP
jgi:hypothetical protein